MWQRKRAEEGRLPRDPEWRVDVNVMAQAQEENIAASGNFDWYLWRSKLERILKEEPGYFP